MKKAIYLLALNVLLLLPTKAQELPDSLHTFITEKVQGFLSPFPKMEKLYGINVKV